MGSTGRVLAVQAGLGIVCSMAFYIRSPRAGTSAMLALACVLIPAGYYAWVQARTLNGPRLLFQGVMKMVLTMLGMAVSVVVFGVEALGFFVTFAVMQLGYLAGLRA